ncbi:Endonuclease-reverse transcriptase [Popillia japonica]|uniref:Endonuclease-reverse transcriptase n=1 Tax=Popillia japonica TaxID=7064 RepID=A0AAW1KIF4_POPJA
MKEGGEYPATDIGGLPDPFRKRDSLLRTPPKALEVEAMGEKNGSTPICQATQEGGDAQVLKKRKRGVVTPPKKGDSTLETNQEEMRDVNGSLAKMMRRIKQLKRLVDESSKTKLEIKQVARELKNKTTKKVARELTYLADNLEKNINQYQRRHDCTEHIQRSETKEMSTQTALVGKTVGVQAVQAVRSNIELERQKVEEKIRVDIKAALKSDSGIVGLTDLLDKKWPNDLYERTEMVYSDGDDLNAEGDLALLIDPARPKGNRVVNALKKVHPDLKEVIEKCAGQLDYIVKTVATRSRNQDTTEKTTAIYILPLEIDVERINRVEDTYDMLKRLRLSMHIHPTNKIKVVLGEGLNNDYVRKMCEFIFHSGINIALVTNKEKPKKTWSRAGRQWDKHSTGHEQRKTEEDLEQGRTVKERVDPEEVGVKVKAIKRTAKGDLMLEVDGDLRKANDLKQATSNKINNEVKIANRMVTVHVMDIDAATTGEEVELAMRRMGIQDDKQTAVKAMRPGRDGSQTAIVQVNRAKANLLVKAGRIRIGWVNCRVRERVAVTRCYKCLEFGHMGKECKGPDRSDLCVNCHQPGHKAKECEGRHYCLSCNSDEHRSDTTRCPRFRELIKMQRRTNLGRGRMAHDMVQATAYEKMVDIIIISEPNKKIGKSQGYLTDNDVNVAIHIKNRDLGIVTHESGDGYVCVKWKDWSSYGCYLSPNIPYEEYRVRIDRIMQNVASRSTNAIIAGDFNAKAPLWGSPLTDRRGEYLMEWAAQLNLSVSNKGDTPTFQRGDSGSFIDITWVTEGIAGRVSEWEVLLGEAYTYHHHIYFEVAQNINKTERETGTYRLLQKQKFTKVLKDHFCKSVQDVSPDDFISTLTKINRECTTSIHRPARTMPYWFDEEIHRMRLQTRDERDTPAGRGSRTWVGTAKMKGLQHTPQTNKDHETKRNRQDEGPATHTANEQGSRDENSQIPSIAEQHRDASTEEDVAGDADRSLNNIVMRARRRMLLEMQIAPSPPPRKINTKKKATARIAQRYVSEQNPGVAEILDHLKQKLAAMAKRLRRYRESHLRKPQNSEFATNQKNFLRKPQNSEFATNQKNFYKNLKKTPSDEKENDAMPKKEELLQFWTGIWNTPTNHRITKWYQDEKREMAGMEEQERYTYLGYQQVRGARTNLDLALKAPTSQELKTQWKSKALHGRYITCIEEEHIDTEASQAWLRSGNLFPETEYIC